MGIREWFIGKLRFATDVLITGRGRGGAVTPGPGWESARTYSNIRSFGAEINDEARLFLSKHEPIVNWIVSRVANDIFDDWFTVIDLDDEDSTELDKNVQKILKELNAKTQLIRLFTFEARYGTSLLLCAYSSYDDEVWETPLTETAEGRELVQITPYPWTRVIVDKLVDDSSSLRDGLPEIYEIRRGNIGDDFKVHYSRTVRVATNLDEHPYEGVSLIDIMYDDVQGYRNFRWSLYKMWVRYGSGFPVISIPKATKTQIEAWIDEGYFDNMIGRDYFVAGKGGETVEFKGVAGVSLDPKPFDEVGINALSTGSGIPGDTLKGVSAGALTGSRVNERQYFKRITSKQETAEPTVRALIDILIGTGQIDFQGQYEIRWNSVFETNEVDQARIDLQVSITDKNKLEWMTINELREEKKLGPRDGLDLTLSQMKLKLKMTEQEKDESKPSDLIEPEKKEGQVEEPKPEETEVE